MLVSYRGVVGKDGAVRLLDAALPFGVQVVVVAQEQLSVEEQIKRLEALSPELWRKPFEAVHHAWEQSEPAELEDEALSDDELVTLVHQAREESGV
jgi:hypothetical protein